MTSLSSLYNAPAQRSATLSQLFPAAVVVIERQAPGDPADLMADERQYVAQARLKRLQEFAAGRFCARMALAHFGLQCTAIPVAADRRPVWPSGFAGSITHTSGFCAAAISRETQVRLVGLDSEVVGAPTPDVWPTLCRADELAWIETLPVVQRVAAVTLVFSAKEAFYKCQYPETSEWLDFHDLRIDVTTWGAAAGSFTATAMRSIRFADAVGESVGGRFVFHQPYVSTAVSVAAR